MRVNRVGALWVAMAMICIGAVAGCGGGGDTSAGLPASPAGKAEASNFDDVHSGEIELALEIDRYNKHPEEINMRILGPFLKAGEENLPQLDLAVESRGKLAGHDIEFISGPLLRPEKWIVNFDGIVYEPDRASFEDLKSKFEEAQQEEGGEGNAMACVEAAGGFSLLDAVHHVSFEGKAETLDGVKVEMLGADLDLSAAIDEVIALTEESPGCKAQLEAVGLPPTPQLKKLEKELESSLTAARLMFWVDKNGLVRYAKALVNVELPHNEELEVELVIRLSRVNEVTEIPRSHGYSPYSKLLDQFGLSNGDVKQASAGEVYLGVLEVLANRLFGREGP